MSEVVVLGSGFAGLWAALGAARRLDELGAARGEVTITVISSQPYHDIRVRNYEADLTDCRIPLSEVLDPAGIGHITADVTAIDSASHTVATTLGTHAYDRLVVALGSRVVKPDIPGLREFGFDVDTYDGGDEAAAASRVAERPGRGYRRRRRRGTDRHRDGMRIAGAAVGAAARRCAAGHPRRPQPPGRLRYGRLGAAGDRGRPDRQRGAEPARGPCHGGGRGRSRPCRRARNWPPRPWCGAQACGPTR